MYRRSRGGDPNEAFMRRTMDARPTPDQERSWGLRPPQDRRRMVPRQVQPPGRGPKVRPDTRVITDDGSGVLRVQGAMKSKKKVVPRTGIRGFFDRVRDRFRGEGAGLRDMLRNFLTVDPPPAAEPAAEPQRSSSRFGPARMPTASEPTRMPRFSTSLIEELASQKGKV